MTLDQRERADEGFEPLRFHHAADVPEQYLIRRTSQLVSQTRRVRMRAVGLLIETQGHHGSRPAVSLSSHYHLDVRGDRKGEAAPRVDVSFGPAKRWRIVFHD